MATASDIRSARERVGETQAQFAERFGVHQSTIDRWETDGPPNNGSAAVAISLILDAIHRPSSSARSASSEAAA